MIGMFKKIKNMWSESRGQVLADELKELLHNIPTLSSDTHTQIFIAISRGMSEFVRRNGPPWELHSDKIKEAAKLIHKEALQCKDFDVGKCYGLYILSIFLESGELPGEAAKKVNGITSEMVEEAVRWCDENVPSNV